MKKLNVAVLEDSPTLLNDLIENIKHLDLANVLAHATNTEDFIAKVKQNSNIDALILDIDIIGDSMNGIDVANSIQLPTLFISGKTKDYINGIEDLRIYNDQPIEFLTKPVKDERIKKVFEKFERLVFLFKENGFITTNNNSEFIAIKTKTAKKQSIKIESIAFFDTETKDGKRIILESGKEILTPRMNFTEILEYLPSHFLKINNSTIINSNKVDRFISKYEVGIPLGNNKIKSFLINNEYLEELLKYRTELK